MVVVRAPVRISFGGGGTDLQAYYGSWSGFVVSAAITCYCYVMVRRSRDGGIHLYSADYHSMASFATDEAVPVTEPLILPKAVVAWFSERGLLAQGVDLVLAADVPPGTGLGSSSAMTVALIQALAAYSATQLTKLSLAELACEIEIERLGMPIGRQDQYASAYGGINTLEFTDAGVSVQPLAVSPEVVDALNDRLMLFSTGQARHSASILSDQRRDTATKPLVIESLHRLKALAGEMCTALLTGELDHFGHLLDLGWQQKRSLSTSVSSTLIDSLYSAARAAGAVGGKITGAGGGGFLLLYCPPSAQPNVRQGMQACGLHELAFGFDKAGAQVLDEDNHGQFVSVLAG